MPEQTSKLGIKKPLGNETVSRAAYNENWDIIDQNAQKNITQSATAPSEPVADDLWIDTSTSPYGLKKWDGAAWQKIGAVTPGDIGAETPAGAQAKADAAEAAAKTYAGDVAGAVQANLGEHLSDTANPHNVTKSQVGLGSVLNYGIATKAQAEAGTANNVYMTPLRVKEAIDALAKVFTKDMRTFYLVQTGAAKDVWHTALNVTGKGLLTAIYFGDSATTAYFLELRVTVDDVARIFTPNTDFGKIRQYAGSGTSASAVFHPFVRFETSLKIEARNTDTTARNIECSGDYGLFD